MCLRFEFASSNVIIFKKINEIYEYILLSFFNEYIILFLNKLNIFVYAIKNSVVFNVKINKN